MLAMDVWTLHLKHETITKQTVKYLDITLSKHVQSLYAERYKVLMKGIKPGLDKWRDIWFSQVRKLIVVTMSVLSKLRYRLTIIPLKSPARFFW